MFLVNCKHPKAYSMKVGYSSKISPMSGPYPGCSKYSEFGLQSWRKFSSRGLARARSPKNGPDPSENAIKGAHRVTGNHGTLSIRWTSLCSSNNSYVHKGFIIFCLFYSSIPFYFLFFNLSPLSISSIAIQQYARQYLYFPIHSYPSPSTANVNKGL